MVDYLEFMKLLFFVVLYLTGILVCFFFMAGIIESMIFRKEKKSNVKINAVNMSDLELDEETKKALDNVAQKLANKYVDEMTSDEYEKED